MGRRPSCPFSAYKPSYELRTSQVEKNSENIRTTIVEGYNQSIDTEEGFPMSRFQDRIKLSMLIDIINGTNFQITNQ